MKLYEFAPNPSSRRVTLFLKALGFEHQGEQYRLGGDVVTTVQLNVREGANLTPEYQQKSINGKVPMLELDDGTCISETIAICRYFAQKVGDMSLFGETATEVAKVEMWQRIVEFNGLYAGFQAFRNLSGVYSDRERCVKAWGEESKLRVQEFLPQLDKQLSQSPFVALDRLTIADITAFIFVGFVCNALEIDALNTYQHIQAWHQKLSQLPAFK